MYVAGTTGGGVYTTEIHLCIQCLDALVQSSDVGLLVIGVGEVGHECRIHGLEFSVVIR